MISIYEHFFNTIRLPEIDTKDNFEAFRLESTRQVHRMWAVMDVSFLSRNYVRVSLCIHRLIFYTLVFVISSERCRLSTAKSITLFQNFSYLLKTNMKADVPEQNDMVTYLWNCLTLPDECIIDPSADPKLLYWGAGFLGLYLAFLLVVGPNSNYFWSLDSYQRHIDHYVALVRSKVRRVQLDQRKLMSLQERSENQLKRSQQCNKAVVELRAALNRDLSSFKNLTKYFWNDGSLQPNSVGTWNVSKNIRHHILIYLRGSIFTEEACLYNYHWNFAWEVGEFSMKHIVLLYKATYVLINWSRRWLSNTKVKRTRSSFNMSCAPLMSQAMPVYIACYILGHVYFVPTKLQYI